MANDWLSMFSPYSRSTIQEPASAPQAKGTPMRKIAVLFSLAFGLFTGACADQSSFGPSQLEQVDDNTMAAAQASTDGSSSGKGKKVGGSAGGVKGTGR
jgi:hypothetical protein